MWQEIDEGNSVIFDAAGEEANVIFGVVKKDEMNEFVLSYVKEHNIWILSINISISQKLELTKTIMERKIKIISNIRES